MKLSRVIPAGVQDAVCEYEKVSPLESPVIETVCRVLPEGFILSIRMEKGWWWVELESPDRIQSFGADTTQQAVLAALRVAKDAG